MTEEEKQIPAPNEDEGVQNDKQIASEEPTREQDDIETYPLRSPSEDPRWAVRIVWTWVSIAIFLLLFLTILMILGYWYD